MFYTQLTNDLRMAITFNDIQSFDRILRKAKEYKCPLDKKVKGRTPVALALQQNKISTFEKLVTHSIHTDIRVLELTSVDDNGREETLLVYAARNFNHQALILLVEAGVNMDTCDLFGHTALWYCIRNKMDDLAKYLLRKGSSVKTRSSYNWSPLYMAVKHNMSNDLIKSLIRCNCDLRGTASVTADGSVLYQAAKTGRLELVRSLLTLGAQYYDQQRKNDMDWYTITCESLRSVVRANLNSPVSLRRLCRLAIQDNARVNQKGRNFVHPILLLTDFPILLKHYIVVGECD